MFTIAYRINITGVAIQTVDESVSLTGDGLDQRDVIITPGLDREVSVAFTMAGLKCLLIIADGNCSMETNNATTPGDTFPLVANEPLAWNSKSGIAVGDVFSADVTKLFFSNAGLVDVNVSILVLKDATP